MLYGSLNRQHPIALGVMWIYGISGGRIKAFAAMLNAHSENQTEPENMSLGRLKAASQC